MGGTGQVLGLAAPFVWLGMILAISFLETPLKFRAPGVTLPIALGVGRLVFRALNRAELGLAGLVTIACLAFQPDPTSWTLVAAAWFVLAVQVGVLRPRLDRRARLIIAGAEPPPSRQHLTYITLEGVKVIVLVGLGWTLLTGALT